MTTTPTVRLADEDTDGTIDGFELFSARRALELLKRKLGRERLLDLLADEIDAGDAFLRGHLERSAGEETTGTTTLRAHGISAAEFGTWLGAAFAREEVMLAGHPEHWSIHAEAGQTVTIVETLDQYVCSFHMRPWNDSVIIGQELPPANAQPASQPTLPHAARRRHRHRLDREHLRRGARRLHRTALGNAAIDLRTPGHRATPGTFRSRIPDLDPTGRQRAVNGCQPHR